MLKLSTTILICLLPLSLIAQNDNWKIETITVENGLRSDGVSAILKDRQGFMWFATRMGLHRFDGYDFKIYKYALNDSVSLSSNRTGDLCEDHEGNLWITTADGINMLNPETDQIIHYLHDPEDSASVSEGMRKRIFVDSKGTLWVGNRHGLDQFNREDGSFTHYRHNPDEASSLSGKSVSCIYEDGENTLWIGTYGGFGGLNKMDRASGTFQRFIINAEDSASWSNSILCIYEDRHNKLWFGTGNGLFLYNRQEGIFSRVLQDLDQDLAPQGQMFAAVLQDLDGNYWIRTFTGLYYFDSNLKEINAWRNTIRNPIYAVFENIRSIYQDDSGILWFSKHYDGIAKLIPNKNQFHFYFDPQMDNKSIGSIYLDDSNAIWLEYNTGLFKFDRFNNKFERFIHNPSDSNTISSNRVTRILRDHTGTLWVGTAKGLNRLDKSENNNYKFVQYKNNPNDPSSIRDGYIDQLYEDQSGRLYISLDGKIDIYDRKSNTFLHFQYSKSNLPDYIICCILLEESDRLWAKSKGAGLLEIMRPFIRKSPYSIEPDTIIQYKANTNGLNINDVNCMFKDSFGTYWIGTQGGGLNKMIIKKNHTEGTKEMQFEYFTEEDGLCNDIVNDIHEDDNGYLWLTTENGISRFDPRTENFTNYDKTDGLKSYSFSFKGYKSPTGEMFFPSEYGLLAFHPDSIKDNPIIPPVVITDFLINNKKVAIGGKSPLQTSISYARNIELSHHQNFLSFEFAALNFLHSEKNQYKYKMEGIDQDWIDAGTRRFARYPNLKPGEYTFRVIGSNDDNVWNLEGASLKITINPPWYGSILAYSSYGILVVILILGFVQWRTWEIRKEHNLLEEEVRQRTKQLEDHKEEIERQKEVLEEQNKKILEIDELKSRFFNNISHEFRTPLTLIQGPLDDLLEHARLSKKEIQKLQLISQSSKQLLNLVNQLLDIAKLDSGMVKVKLVEMDILGFLRTVSGSFISVAESKGILYNRTIPNEPYITCFDSTILEKILINLLSNAFKFTPEASEISLKVKLFKGDKDGICTYLEISVTDQGPGIPEKEKDKIFTRFYQVEGHQRGAGTGIGLSLVKDLLQLCHGSISVESNQGAGSTFTVRFPLGKDHMKENEYVMGDQNKADHIIQSSDASIIELTQPSSREEQEIGRSDKPVVLVVEDNPDIRSHIREHLEEKYKVLQSVNGSAGLKMAFERIPDLVITDLIMPQMDGAELCRRLKSDERTSHIPVIMLTAKSTIADKLEGLETGADDYISKPFHMKELIVRTSNIIEQHRKLRSLFGKQIELKPKDIKITSLDEAFLTKAIKVVEEHISDDTFDVNTFQELMYMSHSTLFRKIYALTDLSPSAFVRNIRLKRAAQLLDHNYGNVAKVSFEVGFNNPSYFSKCFIDEFGISPAEYRRNYSNKVKTNPQ